MPCNEEEDDSHPVRKKSREMDAAWVLEVMGKAPCITVSMTDAPACKRKQYDTDVDELKYGQMKLSSLNSLKEWKETVKPHTILCI